MHLHTNGEADIFLLFTVQFKRLHIVRIDKHHIVVVVHVEHVAVRLEAHAFKQPLRNIFRRDFVRNADIDSRIFVLVQRVFQPCEHFGQ